MGFLRAATFIMVLGTAGCAARATTAPKRPEPPGTVFTDVFSDEYLICVPNKPLVPPFDRNRCITLGALRRQLRGERYAGGPLPHETAVR